MVDAVAVERAVRATRAVPAVAKVRVDGMLDLQAVPAAERWDRIAAAIQELDSEREGRWRLKILLSDTPESARELPALVTRLTRAGVRHDATREPGGVQGIVLAPPESAPLPLAA